MKNPGTIAILSILIVVLTTIFFSVTALPEIRTNFKNPFAPPVPTVAPQFKPINNVVVPGTEPTPLVRGKTLVLRRNDASGSATIATFSSDNSLDKIVRWGEWIFFSKSLPDKVQILAHNLTSGETQVLYDRDASGDFNGKQRKPDWVPSMEVIGDQLFFAVGGYLTAGATYYLPLPPMQKPSLLEKTAYRIEKIDKYYFFIDAFGDGCGGGGKYYLFDPDSRRTTFVTNFEVGCQEGEDFIALDKRGMFLMAGHEGVDAIYKYVTAIPLNNLTIKEGVIAREQMPEKIVGREYSLERDQLFLLAPSAAYIFDFGTKQISKVVDFPKMEGAMIFWMGSSVCLYSGQQGESGSEIKIDQKQFVAHSMQCPAWTGNSPGEGDQTLSEKIKALNLPDNFVLSQE